MARNGRPRAASFPLWLVVVPVATPILLGVVLAALWRGEWSPSRLREKLEVVRRDNDRLDRELATARGGMESARRALRLPEKERQSLAELAGVGGAEPPPVEARLPDVDEMIAKARRIRQGYDAMGTWFETHPSQTGRLPTIRPVASTWPVVESFGRERDPYTGQVSEYPGVAWSVPEGTPVWATGAGTVSSVGNQGRWGRYVEIRHDNRCLTFYGHLSRVDVREGETVVRGQVVGLSGRTGMVMGPRMAYAVLLDGDPVDPSGFLLPEDLKTSSR